ncbi:MAG: hypothetical protein IJT65_07895 [Eubacterium sp.]|nr:hypothetical protein [Eubacterium sp.]
MNGFSKAHPTVQLLFFAVAIIIPLSFSNPFISAASLFGAVVFSLVNDTKRGLKSLIYSLAAIVAVGVFNMLFAHYGNTVIFVVKETNFTLEAFAFGINQGMLLASSIIWFTYFGRILDSERLMYLFRFAPKLVLLFSMVLGFIPRFITKFGDIKDAKAGLRGGKKPETAREKMSDALENLSALVTYSLESSIITADSMSARGFNINKPRASRFPFTNRDLVLLSLFIFTLFEMILQKAAGNLSFYFEPELRIKSLSLVALEVFILFNLIPSIIDLRKVYKWKRLNSKK